jgi:hypothetical protein
MNERHPRNTGLPDGIRIVQSGPHVGEYEARVSVRVPDAYYVKGDGSLAQTRRRRTLLRTPSLSAAIRAKQDYREAMRTLNQYRNAVHGGDLGRAEKARRMARRYLDTSRKHQEAHIGA